MGLGLYAPLGIAWASGDSSSDGLTGSAQGLFLSVFGFAAPVNFKLRSGKSGLPENIKLKSLVSPGLWYMWHRMESPISCVIGLSFTPELHSVEDNGELASGASAFRLTFMYSIDIPMFKVFTR